MFVCGSSENHTVHVLESKLHLLVAFLVYTLPFFTDVFSEPLAKKLCISGININANELHRILFITSFLLILFSFPKVTVLSTNKIVLNASFFY